MEHSCSPLHLLAEVACDVRQIEMQLARILDRKLSFPSEFTEKREENLSSNVDSEGNSSKRSMKRKLLFDSEAENQKTKKQSCSMTQSVLDSEPNLPARYKPRISVTGLKWKFHNVNKSSLNSSSAASIPKHGILVDFLKNQFSWQGKRKRSIGRPFLKQQSTSKAVFKGCEKSWKRNDRCVETMQSTNWRSNAYQTELPMQFKTEIQELGGLEAKLVIQKQLCASDVNSSNSRFSIPKKQIQNEFLEENEKHLLDTRAENGQKLCGLDVLVLAPCLGKFNLKLKKWRMDRNIIYNLTHEWNNIQISNGLVEKDVVQLWSFRRCDQLCFALVKL